MVSSYVPLEDRQVKLYGGWWTDAACDSSDVQFSLQRLAATLRDVLSHRVFAIDTVTRDTVIWINHGFQRTTARYMPSSCVRQSVRLFVRLSHAGIVSKRLNVESRK